MGSRHPGTGNDRVNAVEGIGTVVADEHLDRTAEIQRARYLFRAFRQADVASAREKEGGDGHACFPGADHQEALSADPKRHRSFKVLNAITAQRIDKIQKRTMI